MVAGFSRARLMAGVLGLALLTGCAESPPEQLGREDRVAAVPVFELHMPEQVWQRTDVRLGDPGVEGPVTLVPEADGMVRIDLTGEQMADYLVALDHNAHGGISADDPELATAVYDLVARVIDTLPPPAPGQPAPRIVVPATVLPPA
ncbi:hypothetical protein [Nocardia jiangsuensis]|uniref:Uncharacterized protein n=1 Tax=Nocardia jiangsuensis TaxID=1691563 RepID=A0ABV8DZM8_9NOCA